MLSPYHRTSFYIVLAIILSFVITLLFFGYVGLAFKRLGLSPWAISILLISVLLGSFVNIPIYEIRSKVPTIVLKEVKWFGLYYRIPIVEVQSRRTKVAINLGGALIPVAIALYVILTNTQLLLLFIVGITIVTGIVNVFAKPVRGLGIVTPLFIPPITAALTSILLYPINPAPIAYVSGVLGALIGADLLNLKKVGELGAPMVSIGGAGTFDGIFLTGILAVLLA
jgi:uncharacterized membrane protein